MRAQAHLALCSSSRPRLLGCGAVSRPGGRLLFVQRRVPPARSAPPPTTTRRTLPMTTFTWSVLSNGIKTPVQICEYHKYLRALEHSLEQPPPLSLSPSLHTPGDFISMSALLLIRRAGYARYMLGCCPRLCPRFEGGTAGFPFRGDTPCVISLPEDEAASSSCCKAVYSPSGGLVALLLSKRAL